MAFVITFACLVACCAAFLASFLAFISSTRSSNLLSLENQKITFELNASGALKLDENSFSKLLNRQTFYHMRIVQHQLLTR